MPLSGLAEALRNRDIDIVIQKIMEDTIFGD